MCIPGWKSCWKYCCLVPVHSLIQLHFAHWFYSWVYSLPSDSDSILIVSHPSPGNFSLINMLACNICGFNCVSSADYLKLCRSHGNMNNVFYSCGHKDCGRRFSTYNSLTVHMYQTHPDTKSRQTWNRSVSAQLKCSFNFCNSEYGDLKRLTWMVTY